MLIRAYESKASIAEKDSILNYFIKESKNYYTTSVDSLNPFVYFDDLFPFIEKKVLSILSNYESHLEIKIDDPYRQKLFIPILKRLNSLKDLNPSQRTENKLNEISVAISSYPVSVDKIWLLLDYWDVKLDPTATLTQIFNANVEACKQAELIKDVFEKANAYKLIGDHFAEHEISYLSLDAYYKAQFYYYSSDKDSL